MTMKEAAFQHCAFMILHDQCPPDRKHYLCMKEEDALVGPDCIQCWNDFLWGLTMGTVELPTK